ncbi:MAG: hypothetical protein ACI9J2_000707 [Saprospiraceae bacterium]
MTVDVIATTAEMLHNFSGELLSDDFASGKANATLEVTRTDLAITKSFTDDPVAPGSSATLEFVISNFDRSHSASNVSFKDDLTALVPA